MGGFEFRSPKCATRTFYVVNLAGCHNYLGLAIVAALRTGCDPNHVISGIVGHVNLSLDPVRFLKKQVVLALQPEPLDFALPPEIAHRPTAGHRASVQQVLLAILVHRSEITSANPWANCSSLTTPRPRHIPHGLACSCVASRNAQPWPLHLGQTCGHWSSGGNLVTSQSTAHDFKSFARTCSEIASSVTLPTPLHSRQAGRRPAKIVLIPTWMPFRVRFLAFARRANSQPGKARSQGSAKWHHITIGKITRASRRLRLKTVGMVFAATARANG